MEYVFAGLIITGWFSLVFLFVILLCEDILDWRICAAAIFVWVSATVSILVYATANENSKGPCVKSEIQYHWNPATKTTMPARVCVSRGEWEAQN